MPETQLPAHALGRVEAHLENLVDQTRDMAQQVSRMASALEQQVRMIDEDRKDTATHRNRTREQLMDLAEKQNGVMMSVARIIPVISDLERDQQNQAVVDAGAAGEKRGAARVRALVLTVAGGAGAALMWAVSEGLKFFHPR
jgi:uncharacterized protein YhaN